MTVINLKCFKESLEIVIVYIKVADRNTLKIANHIQRNVFSFVIINQDSLKMFNTLLLPVSTLV